jgi:hypothetical protein
MKSSDIANSLLQRLEFRHRKLRQQAVTLREDMDQLVLRLDSDNPRVNACGEVQTLGTSIDLLCAQIGKVEDMLREVERSPFAKLVRGKDGSLCLVETKQD